MNYHSGGIQGGELSSRFCITNYLRIGKLQFRPVSDFGPQSCMQESIQRASCHSESAHTDRLHTSIKRAGQGNLTGSAKDCFYEVLGLDCARHQSSVRTTGPSAEAAICAGVGQRRVGKEAP